MTSGSRFSALFDACPVWLWPVLVWSLWGLSDELARLEMAGDTWFELRLTRWGQAYIAKAPDGPLPTWKDELFQAAMGAPIPDEDTALPKLGIVSADGQTDWAWQQFGRDRRAPDLSSYDPLSFTIQAWLSSRFSDDRRPAAMSAGTGASASANAAMTSLCCCGVRAPP